MLLDEFLKEHRTVEDQERKLQQQESKAQGQDRRLSKAEAIIARQQKQIQALMVGLQQECPGSIEQICAASCR